MTIACWDPGQMSPEPSASQCHRDLLLCRGRRHHAHARRDSGHHAGLVRRPSRRANCTNMPTAPRARSCSVCATARISPPVPRTGRAIRTAGAPDAAFFATRRWLQLHRHRRVVRVTLRRADEAQDADLRRPAGDGTAGRVVAAIENQVIGHPPPFAFDQRIVVAIAEPRFHRPAIGHRTAQRVRPGLAQAVEPGCERRIGIGRRRRQDRACEANQRNHEGAEQHSTGDLSMASLSAAIDAGRTRGEDQAACGIGCVPARLRVMVATAGNCTTAKRPASTRRRLHSASGHSREGLLLT